MQIRQRQNRHVYDVVVDVHSGDSVTSVPVKSDQPRSNRTQLGKGVDVVIMSDPKRDAKTEELLILEQVSATTPQIMAYSHSPTSKFGQQKAHLIANFLL